MGKAQWALLMRLPLFPSHPTLCSSSSTARLTYQVCERYLREACDRRALLQPAGDAGHAVEGSAGGARLPL